ncbi:M28 family metallopeptidase [Pseudooceanicola aestuarii]|uniref:M28 family metallopeptidase n=1 Tax=Pseudooceanicola aestuarii TaxID=2697319 RepID=UPI0013D1D1BC|nr:M28 family peptidase [Pseudooceanicola aestuarii]
MLDREAARNDVTLSAPWALIEAFANQPREKPQDANAGADMIVQALENLGVPVRVYEPEIYMSLPISASVTAGDRTFAAKPPAFCASVPEGVTGELIFMEDASGGTPLDRNPAALDALKAAAGKIAVIEGFALPNFIAGLEAAGAIAVIAVNPGQRIHWGTVNTVWGTPEPEDLRNLPKIPSAAVNRPDGAALIALAREGGTATVRTTLETGWHAQKLPVAEIPGSGETDDFVLVHGHYDSWQEGVGDNGTGNACMIELANVLWRNRAALKRGVRLAWWPGHSAARYGGSAWFADEFGLELDANCVAHLNCDSPGCRWATSYEAIACTSEAEQFVREVVQEVTGQTPVRKRPQRNSDYTFNNIGITGAFNGSSMLPEEVRKEKGYYVVGGCGGNIAWHTEDDTIEIADKDVLDTDIRLYLTAVLRLACDPVLPLDWRAAAMEYAETAASYRQAAAPWIDLAPVEAEIAALATELDAFYAGVESGAIAPDAANAVIRGLARILVPVNYVRGPRFTHDPALNVPPLPAIAAAQSLPGMDAGLRGFALAQVLRGRNRVISALRAATDLIATAG